MYQIKYPNLFRPLKLGRVILRNRIFAAPTGYCDLTRENIATEPLMAYYEAKARGGAAAAQAAGTLEGKGAKTQTARATEPG